MTARVLIVDDNPVNLKLAASVLESAGFVVDKAPDAQAALAAVGRAKPALILMDVAMPGMDGLALTRKLKAQAETKDIIVVALTAFAMKGDDEKAFEAGCDGYIAKPIDTRTLAAQVARALEGAKGDKK